MPRAQKIPALFCLFDGECLQSRKAIALLPGSPVKTCGLQEPHSLRCIVVHLRAGNERNRGEIQLQQTHILDNQSVGAQLIDLPDDIEGLGEFPVCQDGIERHIDLGVI